MTIGKKQISLYISPSLWRKILVLAYLRSLEPKSSFIEFMLSAAISRVYSREVNQQRLQEIADRLGIPTEDVEMEIAGIYGERDNVEPDPLQ